MKSVFKVGFKVQAMYSLDKEGVEISSKKSNVVRGEDIQFRVQLRWLSPYDEK